MAMYRNRINAGSNIYGGSTVPGYRAPPRQLFLDTEESKHSIVGYAASHKSESYESKSEKVEFRQIPAATVRMHSPPRRELYKDHGVGTKPLPPWSSTRDQHEKAEELSPKVIPSHKNRDSSPPPRDNFQATHDHGKYKKLNSFDKDDDVVCNDEVCVKVPKGGTKPNYFKEEEYDHNEKKKGNGYVPPHASYTAPASIQPKTDTYRETSHIGNNEKQKANGPNNHVGSSNYTAPDLLQPRKETYHEAPHIGSNDKHKGNGYTRPSYTVPVTTQPKRDTQYEPSHVDNNEKHKGYGYNRPSYVPTQPQKETYYEPSHIDNYEKYKGNGYAPPSYTDPVTTQPRKETYYAPSHMDNNEKQRSPPSYTIPVKAQPRKDTYYEPSHIGKNEKHKENGYAPPSNTITAQPRKETYYETSDNRPMMLSPPPHIKTRSDHRGRPDVEFYNENGKNSPVSIQDYNSPSSKNQFYQEPEYYNSPPRKTQFYQEPEYYNSPSKKDQRFQETIDSAEARKRYGKGSPRAGEEKYVGTIDSREAARKYNGVFVLD